MPETVSFTVVNRLELQLIVLVVAANGTGSSNGFAYCPSIRNVCQLIYSLSLCVQLSRLNWFKSRLFFCTFLKLCIIVMFIRTLVLLCEWLSSLIPLVFVFY